MSQPPPSSPQRRAAEGMDVAGMDVAGRSAAPTTREQVLAMAADFAQQAPSLHDTQPWRIRLGPDRLALAADRTRRLPGLDPRGRLLVESAGAALFNARVALAHGGWGAEIRRLPRPDDPDVLAEVVPVAGTPDAALAPLAPQVSHLRTGRRRLGDARVSDDVLRRLAHVAESDGVALVPVVDDARRLLVARLAQKADGLHSADQTMVLLATPTDDELAWLHTGEAMQHVLLELTRLDWLARPLTQPIEVPLTRTELRSALTWHAHPQLLLRVGQDAGSISLSDRPWPARDGTSRPTTGGAAGAPP